MVRKVISNSKQSKEGKELSYNEWIDKNFKIICDNKNPASNLINHEGYNANIPETEKIFKKFKNIELADINHNGRQILKLGEIVKKAGGWIKYQNKLEEEKWKEKERENKIKELEYENLVLQKEKLEYQQKIRMKEEEISNLDIKLKELDIKLKNWGLFKVYWWISGIIFSIITYLLTMLLP